MSDTIIKIDGMSCQGCVKNITGVLSALPGVSAVEVSLEDAEARVSLDAGAVSREALVEAIEDAGFDAS